MPDYIFKPSSNAEDDFSNAQEVRNLTVGQAATIPNGTYDIFERVVQSFTMNNASATANAHVFLVAGQSNAADNATPFDSGTDYPSDVYQVADGTSGADGAVVAVTRPMDHPGLNAGADFGPWLQFAIDYRTANPGVPIIFVPMAYTGAGIYTDENEYSPGEHPAASNWIVNDTLFNDAVATVNATMALDGTYQFKGILWHQGEDNAGRGETESYYASKLDTLISTFRANITDADSTTPFVLGGLSQDYIDGSASREPVLDALTNTPDRVLYTGFASAISPSRAESSDAAGGSDGTVHFSPAGMRTLGGRYPAALTAAIANAPTVPVISGVPTIAGSEQVGATLTATAASATGNLAPVTTWQWVNSVSGDISGATSSSYTLQASDEGDTITVRQIETNATGSDTATSTATGAIAAAASFVPADDASLANHWDTSDVSSLTGDPITAIADLEGSQDLTVTNFVGGVARATRNSLTVGDVTGSDTARRNSDYTLPAVDDFAIHGAMFIDTIDSTDDALIAIGRTSSPFDGISLRAGNASQFDGELQATGTGNVTGSLTGGPYSGVTIFSIVLDGTTGDWEVIIDGTSRGTGTWAGFDSTTGLLLRVLGNTGGARIDGAFGEICVTTDLTNASDYQTYLSDKWT